MKTPSGSIFPYYYKDGAFYGLHLGECKKDDPKFLKILNEEQAFFLSQTVTSTVCLDLYRTVFPRKRQLELADFIVNISGKMTRCALVGLSFINKLKMRRQLSKVETGNVLIRYFDEQEIAKTWLVGKMV